MMKKGKIYETPLIEVDETIVEQGFAVSSTEGNGNGDWSVVPGGGSFD